MLGHAGGAATLEAPGWLVVYGTAMLALVATVALRHRATTPRANGAGPRTAPRTGPPGRRPPVVRATRAVGRMLGPASLALVIAVAALGPARAGANLAPVAVTVLWWVGLPFACMVAGDVVGWLDPFGGATRADRSDGAHDRRVPLWTAPAMLGIAAWWVGAYHDAREPRALAVALAVYTVAAVAGARLWGRSWLRRGEGFGALSASLAALRRAAGGQASFPVADRALVAVWLGSVATDLLGGSRAWTELAGSASGWDRTAVATVVLATAITLAWLLLAGVTGIARVAAEDRRGAVAAGVTVALLGATAAVALAHGVTLLVVDGQLAVALAADPFGRGWDLLGTADLVVDYSPLTPTTLAATQLVLAAGGHLAGLAGAATLLRPPPGAGVADRRAALRALWAVGLTLTVVAVVAITVLTTDLD